MTMAQYVDQNDMGIMDKNDVDIWSNMTLTQYVDQNDCHNMRTTLTLAQYLDQNGIDHNNISVGQNDTICGQNDIDTI